MLSYTKYNKFHKGIWRFFLIFKPAFQICTSGIYEMDTQAHRVGPQRRQKERGATTDEMG